MNSKLIIPTILLVLWSVSILMIKSIDTTPVPVRIKVVNTLISTSASGNIYPHFMVECMEGCEKGYAFDIHVTTNTYTKFKVGDVVDFNLQPSQIHGTASADTAFGVLIICLLAMTVTGTGWYILEVGGGWLKYYRELKKYKNQHDSINLRK